MSESVEAASRVGADGRAESDGIVEISERD